MSPKSDTYRFGPFQIHIRTRELFKYGTRLKLRPQPFQVLQLLAERAGDAVTREELRQALWPSETFVDFEHGLNTCVKELRRVLNDSASEPRYIETLPKLGYRMVASVEVEAAPQAVEATPPADIVPVPNPPVRTSLRWWRAPVLYAAMAAMFTSILTGWMVMNRHSEPERSMPTPLTSFPGSETEASWSPDGREVAFMWNGAKDSRWDIYVLQPGASHSFRVTTFESGDNVHPAWSPDGKWIAYVHRDHGGGPYSLDLVSPLGGPARTVLASESEMGSLSWMPDGRAIVLVIVPAPGQPAALWLVWVETGQHQTLTSPPAAIEGDGNPSVAPDGRTVAFCRSTGWRAKELYLLDLTPDFAPSGPERRITNLGFVGSSAWTPDGSRIVIQANYRGSGMCEIDRSGSGLRPIFGVPETASLPALSRRPGGYTSLVFANRTSQTTMWRYNIAAGDTPVEIAPSTRSQRYPRYSGDGKRLAFASNRGGSEEIWVSEADDAQPAQLTFLGHLLTEAPDWSPSGEQIAFVSQDGANRQIYVVNSSGGLATAITNETGIRSGNGWSVDGKGYYYTSTRSGRSEVWKAPSGGGQPRQITSSGGECGFESRRGIFYYWTPDYDERGTLMRRTPDGDQPVLLTTQGRNCRTAPSPKGFYFKSADTGDVYLYDEAASRCTLVFRHPARLFNQFNVSPDGRWLVNDFTQESRDLMIMEHFR